MKYELINIAKILMKHPEVLGRGSLKTRATASSGGTGSLSYCVYAFLILIFISCGKENPVPAYLHIPAFSLTARVGEGTSAHKISDAWVFVDGQANGIFQLPVTIPIIQLGQHDIIIFPGVRNNGTRSNPVVYPMCTSYKIKMDLKAGKVDTLRPTTAYLPEVQFKVIEDFERGNIFKIDRDNNTTNQFTISNNGFEGKCGQFILGKSNISMEKASTTKVQLSDNAANIYLEMHYKTEAPLTVGIVGSNISNTTGTASYKIILYPNKEWNKTYINLTNEVKELKMTDFQILFNSLLPDSLSTATILIDNIKLIQK